MKFRSTLLIALFYCIQYIMVSCSDSKRPDEAPIETTKILALSDAGYHLPDRPGSDLFLANCGICHSYRYIQMQPPFPRKTWEKTVEKMVKNFGAPIPDSSLAPIVDYLVSIRGEK